MDERPSRLPLFARILATLGLLAYPLLVWRGLASGSPRRVALILGLILLPAAYFRLRASKGPDATGLLAIPIVTLTCLGLASVLNRLDYILAVPVAINAVFLITFGLTLRAGVLPMVERFARLQESGLSTEKQHWCRIWTKIWCVFFVLNGTTAGLIGLLGPLEWWALYTGLISYLLSGVLFGLEWFLRHQKFSKSEPQGGV
jgi:uncharacterized membrane protein